MGADDNSDRDAILARRQRFIAMALSGLAVGCEGGVGSPMPCLDVSTEPLTTANFTDTADTGGAETDAPPMTATTGSTSSSGTDTAAGTSTDGSGTAATGGSAGDSTGSGDGPDTGATEGSGTTSQ